MSDLKPCPFCGSKASMLYLSDLEGVMWFVCCPSCGIGQQLDYKSEEDAAEVWNRRANDEAD